MATITAGTAATTTLTALAFTRMNTAADIATIAAAILDDGGSVQGTTGNQGAAGMIWPGAFTTQGLLYVPNRGVLQVFPGDIVAVDSTGWPVLLSQLAAGSGGSGNWRHS